ncbi:hypothetical protein BDR26DRAFT_204960 [Obelidium mucronatum]|nr:hypothetical protein BDR26DRAFT_204960 [Obelidium mucronatum]
MLSATRNPHGTNVAVIARSSGTAMNPAAAVLQTSPEQVQPRRRGRPSNSQRFGNSPGFTSVSTSSSRKRKRTTSDVNTHSLGHGQNTSSSNNEIANAESNPGEYVPPLIEEEEENESDGEDEYGDDEVAARLHFNEQLALREQSDWAHNQQKGTKIYLEHQKEYKTWCHEQQYQDEYVNENRLLVFLKTIQNRGLKTRGRKSVNSFQRRTTRSIAGKITTIERRDKNGKVIYRHPDYDAIVNGRSDRTLSHHSIKVVVNALVHLYFWQTTDMPKNPHPYPRGPTISSFLKEHKQNYSRNKAARLDDAGLEDITMRVGKKDWEKLTLGLLAQKKFTELATLHVDKQAVARHQLARDWHWKDAFLYTLERESVTGGDVVILVGRTNESKTNHFQRAEHFAFFRHRDVMSCAWGWIVELQARGMYSEIAGNTWQEPEVSKRELFYKEKVLGNPTYSKMYKTLDELMKTSEKSASQPSQRKYADAESFCGSRSYEPCSAQQTGLAANMLPV